jgi:transcriptional regulator with XRE-family HTH domain|nr:MAG TPA_asm: helix-turn-helix domain protein [Caudoviricetes sp.]
MMDNIGERIKKERERLELSQAELGRLVGYSSRSTINKIEKGERDIPRDKVAKFAQVLDVNPAYLAGFTEADIPDGLNKEYYLNYIHDSKNPDFLAAIEGTPSDDLCIKIKASDLNDSEVDYMDKQLDFIVGQRK